MSRGWNRGALTTADAFSYYYSHFTRDQNRFESQLALLKTPVKVVWGEKDLYIKKEMGVEFAERIQPSSRFFQALGTILTFRAPSGQSTRFVPHSNECALAYRLNLCNSADDRLRT
jgi:pimeloyl-ACP methyl ester carboxylesterase